jgi:hypothetical protein
VAREVEEARISKMDARNPHGLAKKFSWALSFTAVVAACLALAECGVGWARGITEASLQEPVQRLGDKDQKVRREAAQDLGLIWPGAKEELCFLRR